MIRRRDFRAPWKPHIMKYRSGMWVVLWRGRISPQPSFEAACARALFFNNIGRRP